MYAPIVHPQNLAQPLPTAAVTISSPSNQQLDVSYQLFDDLTSLTEQVLKAKSTSIPSEDNIGNVSFYNQASISLPAIGARFTTIVTFQVPIGYNGVIKKIENNITGGGFTDGSGDVIWQIIIDDVPAKNYETILTERGDPNSPVSISPIFIYSGQNISYVVNHVANPALAGYAIAALVGYFYPQTSIT